MKTHGMSKTRFYKIWKGMFTRCYDKNYKLFKNHGGRGILVCNRWFKFENFKKDMFSTYQENLSIERVDNNGHYDPLNCKWATRQEQNNNKRMHKLTKEKVREIRSKYSYGNGRLLAKEYNVSPGVISEIINYSRNYSKIT